MSQAGAGRPPVGVILFNLGGPPDQASVEPFLVNLFSDRDIIRLPGGARLQPAVARVIAKLRGPSVRRNYRLIGGGSPQLHWTERQAEALERRLNAASAGGFIVTIAMRYWHPGAQAALRRLRDAGARRVVTLPLYPHWSCATTGSSERDLERALEGPEWNGHPFEIDRVTSYAEDPLYLDAMADTARRAFEGLGESARREAVLLFSAHGLPQKFVDAGDPYVEQIEATRRGILERLALPNRHLLGYQSRTGPVKWIGPGTDELIESLAREGQRTLLVIPLSFVSDHIETSYEIDILFGDLARKAGIAEYRRPEMLGVHPLFIESLARQVESRVGAPAGAR